MKKQSEMETSGMDLFVKMRTEGNKDKNSNLLKNLSMAEILKLAENRARVAGTNYRRWTDNPWHKRMAVSDNITRHQATSFTLSSNQQIGSIAVNNESDNNEHFFENLLQKMTRERFMPCDVTSRLKKRTCLWNKENLTNSQNTTKRHKSTNRIDSKLFPRTMELFAKRLLPRQNNSCSPVQSNILCDIRKQNQVALQCQSPPAYLHDHKAENKLDLRSISCNFSSHPRISTGESFCGNRTIDDTVSNWNSTHLSTVVEHHESPMIIKCPVLDAINMEFNAPRFTPPLSTESFDCKACQSAEIEYEDNANDNYSHLFSLVSDNSSREILEIPDKNLFRYIE